LLFRDEVKANNHVTCGQCCNSGKVPLNSIHVYVTPLMFC
jgi:hypothetical protein